MQLTCIVYCCFVHKQQYKASWLSNWPKIRVLLTGFCLIKLTNQNYKVKLQWTFCKYDFTVCKINTAFSHLKSLNIWATIPTKHGIKIIFFGANTWFKYCKLNHSCNNRQFAVQIGMVLHSSSCFILEVMLVHSNISFLLWVAVGAICSLHFYGFSVVLWHMIKQIKFNWNVTQLMGTM